MSSLRRSVLNFSFKSPENDDEEERRDSRRRTLDSSTAIDENETLKTCLKNYQEQKLNKENAWTVPLIDTLSSLMQKHNKLVKNFQVVGTTLEASSKLYGYRVDSVHSDIIRMSSGLTKQTFVDLEAAKETPNPDDTQGGEEAVEVNKPTKKKKKQISTIARNKGFLNAKLETHPFVDSFFSKLNAVENISGPNRALLNILTSNNSELKIKMSNEFWDSSEQPMMNFTDEIFEDENYTIPLETELSTEFLIRPKNSGYIISDTAEDEDKSDDDAQHDNLNTSQLSVAFDINAEIDNIPENNFIMDVEMDDFDCLTLEDQRAINACKELRRAPVLLQDMRPIDSNSILEYSYRPTDIIDKFWAGPSHWKFKKIHNKLVQDPSEISSKKKKNKKFEPMIFENLEIDVDLFFGGLKKKNRSAFRNWDPKKNMLPTNLLLDERMFDKYFFAPGLTINITSECVSPDIIHSINDGIDNVGNDLNEFHGNGDIAGDMQNVSEISLNFVGAPDQLDKINLPIAAKAKVIDMKLLKTVSLRILDEKSKILPVKTLSDSDRKNLERATGKLKIEETYTGSVVSYSDVCTDVYSSVPKTQADNMSRAVAFYTILHLANEYNLRLIQSDNLEDFQIWKIQY